MSRVAAFSSAFAYSAFAVAPNSGAVTVSDRIVMTVTISDRLVTS